MRRLTALLACALFAAPALAQSLSLSYSGYLLDAGDVPTTASVPMSFRLYDAPTGGTEIWDSGAACAVQVKSGYFAVLLGGDCGAAIPASAFDGAARYLELTANGVLLLPRTTIGATPVAQRSIDAQALATRLGTAGAINALDNPVEWTQLRGVPGGLAAGSGAELLFLGSAKVGDETSQTLTQALATAGSGNATQLLGVPIDDAAKADGRVLAYNATTQTIEYRTAATGGGAPPAVPASVTWTGSSTGNAQCAVAKGICTQSYTAGGASQGCGTSSSGGSAACAESASINASATWSAASSGNAQCALQQATCVQAYGPGGVTQACNVSIANGAAACALVTAGAGWDLGIGWTTARSGFSGCATQLADCVQAYDGSGNAVACTEFNTAGAARCLKVAPGGPWDTVATWSNGAVRSGNVACAKVGATCLDTTFSGPTNATYPCTTNLGASGYLDVARCRKVADGDEWDLAVSWSGSPFSGNYQCALQGATCVRVIWSGSDAGVGNCNTGIGGAGYETVALCRKGPAGTFAATWSSGVRTGAQECARLNGVCLDGTHYQSSNASAVGTNGCAQGTGGSGYLMAARCRPVVPASDGWDKVAEWNGTVQSGGMQCARLDATCVEGAYYTNNSNGVGSNPCNVGTGGAGYQMTAKCRSRTAADSWDVVAEWNGSVEMPIAQCAKQDANCVEVYYSNGSDGVGMNPCTAGTGGASYSMLARCRTRPANGPWDMITEWQSTLENGAAECVKAGGECYDVSYANGGSGVGQNPCTAPTGGTGYRMLARCKRATVATHGWNAGVGWNGPSFSGNAQCAAIGGTCVSVVSGADGSAIACGTSVTRASARCLKP